MLENCSTVTIIDILMTKAPIFYIKLFDHDHH